jgi:cytidylate kinase
MSVVTISGQIGSGAREIGRATADQLGLEYVDQEILVEAARALGVPMESVVSFDERTASFGERLAGVLRRFLERSAAAGAGDPMLGTGGLDIVLGRTYGEAAAGEGLHEVSEEQYVTTLTGIMRDLASHGDVLIIGRGSQVVLRDWPGSTHALLVAPRDARVRFIVERDGLSEDDAAKRVHDGEKGRVAFHQKFFKVDPNDPSLYHITVNVARYAQDDVAQLLAQLVQRAAAGAQTA